jgi:hypothetical protein
LETGSTQGDLNSDELCNVPRWGSNVRILSVLAAALGLCWLSCASTGRSKLEKQIATAAAEREQYCDEETDQAVPDVLRAVQSAEPLYVNVRLGKTWDSRLLGARLWLPARQGWTSQWLERTLRCHEASSALQRQFAAADPFWLPESWVDIEVLPDRGAFVALLRTNSVAEGRRVYARAQEFVELPPGDR